MMSEINLQENFLRLMCNGKTEVNIFLVNGIKLHGKVIGFDDNVIILQNSIKQMVYKNSISTVMPM